MVPLDPEAEGLRLRLFESGRWPAAFSMGLIAGARRSAERQRLDLEVLVRAASAASGNELPCASQGELASGRPGRCDSSKATILSYSKSC